MAEKELIGIDAKQILGGLVNCDAPQAVREGYAANMDESGRTLARRLHRPFPRYKGTRRPTR